MCGYIKFSIAQSRVFFVTKVHRVAHNIDSIYLLYVNKEMLYYIYCDSLAESTYSHASLLAVGETYWRRYTHEDEVGLKPHESSNVGRIVEVRSTEQSVLIKKAAFDKLIILFYSASIQGGQCRLKRQKGEL